MLGFLRAAARGVTPKHPPGVSSSSGTLPFPFRSFSSQRIPPNTSGITRIHCASIPSPVLTRLKSSPWSCHPQQRHLSLSSLNPFASKRSATPQPFQVSIISKAEADADASPHDVAKQLELFEVLAALKLKAAYETIIARWERMCEFVSILTMNSLTN
jgi:ATP-dependent metalloprotease